VALTTEFWTFGGPNLIYLRSANSSEVEIQASAIERSAASKFLRRLSIVDLPDVPIEGADFLPESESRFIGLHYDLSPILDDPSMQKIVMRDLNLTDNPIALVSLELHALWKASYKKFSPALGFDDKLGKTHDFAEAFPSLEKLSPNYQIERLDSLSTSLEEAAQQSKEQIEVFGAKISNELIPLFGLPVLAIFLFQFSAVGFYVAFNVDRLEVEDASQWSFLLSGWPFLALSFGTIFALPAAASIANFFSVPGETFLPKPISLLFAIGIVVCAAVAFVALQRLRLTVRRSPRVQRKRQET